VFLILLQSPSQRAALILFSDCLQAVILAALAYPDLARCTGIELVQGLHDAAVFFVLKTSDALTAAPVKQPPAKTAVVAANAVIDSELQAVLLQLSIQQTESSSNTVPIEKLANLLVAKVGHKRYKQALKGYSSFRKYLLQQTLWPVTINDSGDLVTFTDCCSPSSSSSSCSGSELGSSALAVSDAAALIESIAALDIIETAAASAADSTNSSSGITTAAVTAAAQAVTKVTAQQPPTPDLQPQSLDSTRIHLQCGDIFANGGAQWTGADIVYCASLLFSDTMVEQLAAAVCSLKPGARVISLRELRYATDSSSGAAQLTLMHEGFFQMSWQKVRCLHCQYCEVISGHVGLQ
jgi:hypothetical protein